MSDVGVAGRDEAIGGLDALDRTEALRATRIVEAFDLGDVEDARRLGDTALAVIVGALRIGIDVELLVVCGVRGYVAQAASTALWSGHPGGFRHIFPCQ